VVWLPNSPVEADQMDIPEELRCLYAAQVEEESGSYRLVVPDQEVEQGTVKAGETYRVAILPSSETSTAETQPEAKPDQSPQTPPVEEGERREVEIEDIGEQGDGITRVERGFVVIVPETDQGERVTIEITDVRENVAFADVVEREDYFQ
jgi:predicted RNA-binding protein with TRAM domain